MHQRVADILASRVHDLGILADCIRPIRIVEDRIATVQVSAESFVDRDRQVTVDQTFLRQAAGQGFDVCRHLADRLSQGFGKLGQRLRLRDFFESLAVLTQVLTALEIGLFRTPGRTQPFDLIELLRSQRVFEVTERRVDCIERRCLAFEKALHLPLQLPGEFLDHRHIGLDRHATGAVGIPRLLIEKLVDREHPALADLAAGRCRLGNRTPDTPAGTRFSGHRLDRHLHVERHDRRLLADLHRFQVTGHCIPDALDLTVALAQIGSVILFLEAHSFEVGVDFLLRGVTSLDERLRGDDARIGFTEIDDALQADVILEDPVLCFEVCQVVEDVERLPHNSTARHIRVRVFDDPIGRAVRVDLMFGPFADPVAAFNDRVLERLGVEDQSVLFKNLDEPAKCFGSLPTALLL